MPSSAQAPPPEQHPCWPECVAQGARRGHWGDAVQPKGSGQHAGGSFEGQASGTGSKDAEKLPACWATQAPRPFARGPELIPIPTLKQRDYTA
jgi:hypothetical protein